MLKRIFKKLNDVLPSSKKMKRGRTIVKMTLVLEIRFTLLNFVSR